MKKQLRTDKKPSLTLRREHIRVLTPIQLEAAVGGAPNDSDGCEPDPKGSVGCGKLTGKVAGDCA